MHCATYHAYFCVYDYGEVSRTSRSFLDSYRFRSNQIRSDHVIERNLSKSYYRLSFCLFAHCILPYHTFEFTTLCLISFPFIMFCFISFHLTSLSFPSLSSHIRFPPDGSSLSGHVSRCNLCERTSGSTQMTFTSGVEICWKIQSLFEVWSFGWLWGSKAHADVTWFFKPGELHQDLVVGMAHLLTVSILRGSASNSSSSTRARRCATWSLMSKSLRKRIFDVRKWWSSDFIADLAMIEKDMIKALS